MLCFNQALFKSTTKLKPATYTIEVGTTSTVLLCLCDACTLLHNFSGIITIGLVTDG
jgi:hypothetical protein